MSWFAEWEQFKAAQKNKELTGKSPVCSAKESVYTNQSMNKLTETGNKIALDYLLALPIERRHELTAQVELVEEYNKAKKKQTNLFADLFRNLTADMKRFKWSKEKVQKLTGVSWKDLRSVYFAEIG